jgi:hypothetical protein
VVVSRHIQVEVDRMVVVGNPWAVVDVEGTAVVVDNIDCIVVDRRM